MNDSLPGPIVTNFRDLFSASNEDLIFVCSSLNSDCSTDCGRYLQLLKSSLSGRSQPIECSIQFSEHSRNSSLFLYPGDYAILDLNKGDEEYNSLIGDAGRSLIKRAVDNYYEFFKIAIRDHDEDIRRILNSDTARSGRQIPIEWTKPNYQLPLWTRGLCHRHEEEAFGVFKYNTLVAICTVRFFGELASFNYIIGHSDHLKYGVMNLLISEIRKDLRRRRPEVSYLHYTHLGRPEYAPYYSFKKGTGFLANNIALVESIEEVIVLRNLQAREVELRKKHIVTAPTPLSTQKKVKIPKLFKAKLTLAATTDINEIRFEFAHRSIWDWIGYYDLKRTPEVTARVHRFLFDCVGPLRALGDRFSVLEIKGDRRARLISINTSFETFNERIVEHKEFIAHVSSRGDLAIVVLLNQDRMPAYKESLHNSLKNSCLQYIGAQDFFHENLCGAFIVLARI